MIVVYSLQNCPRCEEMKNKLAACGYEYEERPMDTAESITDMRIEGCFAMEAPVLRVDDTFYEYCNCSEENFFSELFHVRHDQKEIPPFDEVKEA